MSHIYILVIMISDVRNIAAIFDILEVVVGVGGGCGGGGGRCWW